jgi:phosphatidylserine/phosphatidylglycerophosphate/cardiolipin synthase-like enzyme
MPSLKKNLITLILIVLVYSWFFVAKINHPTSPNVLGAATNTVVFVQPMAGEAPIVSEINNAQKEVLVEVYLLSDKQIINALEAAVKRGVDVKVMLEQHPFGGNGLNNKTKQAFESSGISVEWTNPKFALTHEKAIVIDNNEAFILNQNLTTASFTKNREYNVIDTNPEDVSQIRQMFVADWQRTNFNPASAHLIDSPDTSRGVISALIEQAKQTIDIEMEVVEDNEMITLLSQKAKNTTIRILAPPTSQITSNKKSLARLKEAGVFVKTLSSPYIHAKLILVDGTKAYVGSINLSSQSMDGNRELGIILSGNNIGILSSTFSQDFENAKDFGAN